MRKAMRTRIVRGVLLGLALSVFPLANGTARSFSTGEFSFEPPADWQRVETVSRMRAAEFRIPGSDGGADGVAIVYLFRKGVGGSAEANIARWYSSFQEDPGALAAIVETREEPGLRVDLFSAVGTLAGRAETRPNYGLSAARLAGLRSTVFIRLVGPGPLIRRTLPAFRAMVNRPFGGR